MAETSQYANPASGRYYLFLAVFVSLVSWGLRWLELQTGMRIFGEIPEDWNVSAYLPSIAITIVVFPLVFVLWRRAVGIVKQGVEVTAEITQLGAKKGQFREIHLAYEWNGEEIRVKKSLTEPEYSGKGVGDVLMLIIDRRKPTRFLVKLKRASQTKRDAYCRDF